MAKSRSSISSDAGLVTAEFAIVMPVVVGMLVFGLAVISAQVQAARIQQLAAVASHALARFEDSSRVKGWLHEHAPTAKLTSSKSDGVLCATVAQSITFVVSIESFKVSEQSCTWVGQAVGSG
jgi:Flp pilus assembly protein TadG